LKKKNNMNIGIIKFGLVIYDYGKHYQGGDREIIGLYDILSKEHNVFIISALDKKSQMKKYNGEKLDIIFAFNGPWSKRNDQITILRNYTLPYIKFLNETTAPWVYIQSDNRKQYDSSYPSELLVQPAFNIGMFTDSKKKYFDFDKVSIYNRPFNFNQEKEIQFGVIMNDTDIKRTKKLLNALKWMNICGLKTDLKGKWNNKYCSGVLSEEEVPEYLKKVKYTVNIAVEPLSTSQKIWEYIMNDVVCFCMDYDLQCNILPKDSYLRVKDEYELYNKIDELEKNKNKYNEILTLQRSMLEEYKDGSYILDKYNNLIETICSQNSKN